VQDGIQLEFDKIEGDVRVHCDNRNRFIVGADESRQRFSNLKESRANQYLRIDI